jgi:hypothetical protein
MLQPEPTGRTVVAATAPMEVVAVAGRTSLPEQPCDGEFQLPVVPDAGMTSSTVQLGLGHPGSLTAPLQVPPKSLRPGAAGADDGLVVAGDVGRPEGAVVAG